MNYEIFINNYYKYLNNLIEKNKIIIPKTEEKTKKSLWMFVIILTGKQYKKIENAEKDALSASFSCRCLEKHYKNMSV